MILKTSYKMKPPVSAKPIKSILTKLGCISLWPMNESSGGIMFDVTDNGYNDISLVEYDWVTGKFGSAIQVDNTFEIALLNYLGLRITGDITIECMFKLNQLPSIAGTSMTIVYKGGQFADSQMCYGIFVDDGNDKIYGFYSGDGAWPADLAISNSACVIGVWYHAVFVKKGAIGYLFVDGIQQAGTQVGEGLTIHDAAGAKHGLSFGCRYGDQVPDHESHLDGVIDHSMISNRPFVDSEINQHYLNPFFMFERRSRLLFAPAAPPEIECLFMDLSTQYWAIKHSQGLLTKL